MAHKCSKREGVEGFDLLLRLKEGRAEGRQRARTGFHRSGETARHLKIFILFVKEASTYIANSLDGTAADGAIHSHFVDQCHVFRLYFT